MAKSRRKVRALIFAFKGISKNIYDLKRSVDYLSSKHSFTNGNIFSYPRIIHKYIFPFYCFDFVFAAYFLFHFSQLKNQSLVHFLVEIQLLSFHPATTINFQVFINLYSSFVQKPFQA